MPSLNFPDPASFINLAFLAVGDMSHLNFLQDLAIVMSVAAFATILFRQFKQPVVLGYILAGLLIGPHTPPFGMIADEHNIETLAHLGVIFLMFSLGLEFSFRKLQKVGAVAFIAASLEIVIMIWAGYELGRLFGWNQMDSIFLGAILSISSTTIIIKALEALGKKNDHFANIIIGILIVEDILAIVMIALLSGFAMTGQLNVQEIGGTVLGLSSFLGILLVVGLIAVPRLLNYVAKFKSDEMLLVTVVGLCFGVSLITVKLGYSVALGAFLIGAIIAESRHILRIENLMLPVRDLFSAVFFVSIGLLIDPGLIVKYAWPILAISVVVIVGKVFSCALGCFISGNAPRDSLKVGMSLAQIGEFSFIIAALGLSLKVTSDFVYPIAVAVSAITTLTTPYLINMSDGVVNWFDRVAPKPLLRGMEAYTTWVGNFTQRGSRNMERKILTKLGIQIGINLLIVTGIFIASVFLHRQVIGRWPDFPGGVDGSKAAMWLAAMLVSFPLLIAVWRKLEVVAMLISELSVNTTKAGAKAPALQAIISSTIIVVATGALILVVLVLSSAILPSRNVLLLAVLIASGSGFLLYRGAVKLYARAQSALQDTFAEPADPHPGHGHAHEEVPELPPLLREAKLKSVRLPDDSEAVGKMISELKLRSETGASVVGIDRQGTSIINPGPTEELAAGDEVLLIGLEDQLTSAAILLTTPVAEAA
jgi:CPA2 family monovalent cation:H+ antiporter-2